MLKKERQKEKEKKHTKKSYTEVNKVNISFPLASCVADCELDAISCWRSLQSGSECRSSTSQYGPRTAPNCSRQTPTRGTPVSRTPARQRLLWSRLLVRVGLYSSTRYFRIHVRPFLHGSWS